MMLIFLEIKNILLFFMIFMLSTSSCFSAEKIHKKEQVVNIEISEDNEPESVLKSSTIPFERKLWALAMTAILTQRNHRNHLSLPGQEISPKNIDSERYSLMDWWNVFNRDNLFDQLDRLDQYGHRGYYEEACAEISKLSDIQYNELINSYKQKAEKSPKFRKELEEKIYEYGIVRENYEKLGDKSLIGWDYCRYISLCRWGYLVGYLSEDEAWEKIMYAAEILGETFDSWADLGENYLIGRRYWSAEQTRNGGDLYEKVYKYLLNDPESPWVIIPWNLKENIADALPRERVEIYLIQGKAYLSSGELNTAKKKFDKAMAIDSTCNRLIDNLCCSQAKIYFRKVMIKEAMEVLHMSLTYNSQCDFANYKLACCYCLNNDLDAAMKYLKIAISLNPLKIKSELEHESALNNLRKDSRFIELIN